jgi:hypothetical protein
MKIKITSTRFIALSLSVFALASCNKQEDAKLNNIMPYRGETSQAELLTLSSVNSAMTLEDKVNGVDYIFANTVEVNANITIKPGVTIMFEDGAGLIVKEEGSITAIGQKSNEILFTSKSGKRGAWKGITFLSNTSKNVLEYCIVEHGGGASSFGASNIVVGSGSNTGQVSISNTEIRASKNNGIILSKGSQLNSFTGNKIHTNSAHPISMNVADVSLLSSQNTYNNNGREFIQLTANDLVSSAVTLNSIGEPYLISGQITTSNSFTIAAGTHLSMDEGAELVIDGGDSNGSFTAIGTANSPIIISGIYNQTGVWNSIQFKSSNSANNRIEYCTISGGGNGSLASQQGMITVVNANGQTSAINIRNSSINNSSTIGVYIKAQNTIYNSDIISANTFNGNAKGNVQID